MSSPEDSARDTMPGSTQPREQPGTRLAPAAPDTGAVIIPVKTFTDAKGRLSPALGEQTRAELAREMATHLVQAQGRVAVGICCDDEQVAEWATSVGAATIWCPGTDLNGAVQCGLNEVRAQGYQSVLVAHSDLPLAGSLDRLLGWPGVTLVPDRHRTGTNVMSLPTSLDFTFSYGVNSFPRHVIEALKHGRGLRIVHDERLGWDVDDPSDLELPQASFLTTVIANAPKP